MSCATLQLRYIEHRGRLVNSNSLLLLSGGMDSIALAWAMRPQRCVTIDYGQIPAAAEIRAAAGACSVIGLKHDVLRVDCSAVGSGQLSGSAPLDLAPIPEWWPFRNQLLITLVAAHAVRWGSTVLIIGTVASDACHADGTSAFIEVMSKVLELQEGALRLQAPALQESSVQLCRRAGVPHSVLAWAHSCHVSEYACGTCRGCIKHRITMRELGFGEY